MEGTSKEYRGVYFLGPTFGFCYNYNKSANSKDPIIREIGPELSLLFLWYVLVFRRMYVELSRVESSEKLYQFDAMLPDNLLMKAISTPTDNGENVTVTTRKKNWAIEKFKGDTFRV